MSNGAEPATTRPWYLSCLHWILQRLVSYWTRPIRAEPLALFRIVMALTVLGSALVSFGPYIPRYFTGDSLISSEVADEYLEITGRFSLLRGLESLPLVGSNLPQVVIDRSRSLMDSPTAVDIAFSVWIVSLLSLMFGFFSRTSALVAWMLGVSFAHRAIWILNGGDEVITQGIFYLMLAPAGAAWSIDSWWRRGRLENAQQPKMISPWPVRLIQIQLCCIYFFTAVSKLDIAETNDYLTGEAVYWVLNNATLNRWAYALFPVPLFLCRLASWGTIVFELGFPFLVCFRLLRPWILLLGMSLHIGIWISMDIAFFSPATMCFYAVFLSPEFVVRFKNLLNRSPSAEAAESADLVNA